MSKSICRTCLAVNIKMHVLKNTKLHEVLEKLTGIKLNREDERSMFCYICYTQLQRCTRFMDMSRKADKMFQQVLAKGIELVPESIKALRATYNFIVTPVECMFLPVLAQETLVTVKVEPTELKEELVEHDYNDLLDKVKVEGTFSADELPDSVGEEDQETVQNMLKPKPYTCSSCYKSYQSQQSLKRHISRVHNRQFSYNSEDCKGFTQLDTKVQRTTTHMESHYSCNTCSMTFTKSIMYSNHVRKHTKPFSCHLCDKSFSELSSLRKHKTSHSTNKPFTCAVCDKSFSHRSFLIVHLRSHTGEKPYACEICDKTFAQSGHKISHVRSHKNVKPFPCMVCGKPFAERNTLKKHMKTHSVSKPYSCEICRKTFSNQDSVIRHICTHSADRNINNNKQLFMCVGCGKGLSTKGNLVKHMKRHQKNPEVVEKTLSV